MQRWRAVIKSHLKHFSVSWRYLLFKIHCGRLQILNMSAVYLASQYLFIIYIYCSLFDLTLFLHLARFSSKNNKPSETVVRSHPAFS